ncbi:hypothetical protein BDQ17DRAFT_1385686 [Cyathus striatus]|nr:hypothetical protein BDQ17DRAFT_1385686 [Cyathus striatus]
MVASESPRAKSALEMCINVAQNLKNIYEKRSISCHLEVPQPIPIPSLNISILEDVDNLLGSIDVPDSISRQITLQVTNDVEYARNIYQTQFEQACRELLSIPRHVEDIPLDVLFIQLQKYYQNMLQQRLVPILQAKILHAQEKWRTHRNTERQKQSFNRECTPLLEKYFEYNAYPSPPDRMKLARTCKMTQRQIEVWFQNHRNRAKKEGKLLRRLQISLFAAPDTNGVLSPDDVVALDESLSDSDAEPASNVGEKYAKNPLDIAAPAHAYPARFNPRCRNEQFPHDKDGNCVFRSPPLTWMRKPAVKSPHSVPVNFDDFVESFATKLHLRVPSKKVTKPSPAPHPALIRSTCVNAYLLLRPREMSARAANNRKAIFSLPNRVPSVRPCSAELSMPANNCWKDLPRSVSSTSAGSDRSFSSSFSSSSSTLSTPSSSPTFQPGQLQCADDISYADTTSHPLLTHDDFIFSSLQNGLLFTPQLVHA